MVLFHGHTLIIVFMWILTTALSQPKCVDHCGNISIPFPFGTTPDCYYSPQFFVTCNHSKVLLGNSTIEITDISLHGQLKVLKLIAKDCYDRNGSNVHNNRPLLTLSRLFTINNTANKFTIVGCDAYGFAKGIVRPNRSYETGCTAMCYGKEDLVEGSCMGLGCCQTSIPRDVWKLDTVIKSYHNYTNVSDFNTCGYAFVVEDSAFRFSKKNLTNLQNVTRLPLVVDWVIGNVTCKAAKTNASSYACKSPNSTCYDPENGYGYRCRCQDNYQGNPYLVDGCKDINECQGQAGVNKCTHECVNTEGGFYCRCPKGYRGDGIRGGQGCIPGQQLLLKLLAGIAVAIIALLLMAILLYIELKRRSSRRTKHNFFLQNGGVLLQQKLNTRQASPDMVKIFTSSDLQKATNNFHDSTFIAQGGFGLVYKGILPEGTQVAIKKSKMVDPNQIEQFINEVFVLSQINHRNVVRLLGCCLETEVPLLVYEFINNGTLSTHIHNQSNARLLDWDTRLKIATQTAGVLSYLHSAASTPIIHRDVKSDNILLDHNFTAKVSDFGASKLVPMDLKQLSTVVMGTLGYLDPEYMLTHQLTEKSDVYSFGVVLLELLTGRRAMSYDRPEEEKTLANFFMHVVKQKRLSEIVDGNIVRGDGSMEQIEEVARVAKACLCVKGEDRPTMKEVAMELQGLIVGSKHSWTRDAEEIECLVGKNMELSSVFGIADGNSSTVGYDHRAYYSLEMDGGR